MKSYDDFETAQEYIDSLRPVWVDSDEEVDLDQIQAIQTGGCSSGAYMPAVVYHTAAKTMDRYGDEVLAYLETELGEIPAPRRGESWAGMGVFYLSYAVELWASRFDVAEMREHYGEGEI